MTKNAKTNTIAELKEQFENANFFYVTDSSTLSVDLINGLRRTFFENGITMTVAKNTLIRKALEQVKGKDYSAVYDVLHGPSTIIFTETSNLPAKLIQEFRKKKDKVKPALKAAYIDGDVILGDDQLETLIKLKSKKDLIGEVLGLLQTPARNVISALQSGGQTIAGIVKTLEEKAA